MSHILVVDDDRRLRELLQKFLMDNGFRVTVATDAEDARQRMRAMEFDLIVMDRMMPGEDGLAFTRALRETSTVPILMLTAMFWEVGLRQVQVPQLAKSFFLPKLPSHTHLGELTVSWCGEKRRQRT